MKKFIITEEEKKRIMGLYEQSAIIPKQDTEDSTQSESYPLSPQKISEFIGYARVAKDMDREGNGKKNQDALKKMENFCLNNRPDMFSNVDWTQPKVEGGYYNKKEISAKVTSLIRDTMNDLSGIGNPIQGLSKDVLGKLSDLTLITDMNDKKSEYLKIQTVCMFLNGFRAMSKRDFSDEVYEDIGIDLGQRHTSWHDTGYHLTRYIKT